MQINRVSLAGSTNNTAHKIYRPDTVITRLLEKKESDKNEKQVTSTRETKTLVYNIEDASTTETLLVQDVDCLFKTDEALCNILKATQIATNKYISSEDRENCQKELNFYLNEINEIGKDQDYRIQEHRKKTIPNYVDSGLRFAWTSCLDINGLSVETEEKVQDTIKRSTEAINRVTKEINDLTVTETTQTNLLNNDQKTDSSKQSDTAYLTLIKTSMLSDTTRSILSQASCLPREKAVAICKDT